VWSRRQRIKDQGFCAAFVPGCATESGTSQCDGTLLGRYSRNSSTSRRSPREACMGSGSLFAQISFTQHHCRAFEWPCIEQTLTSTIELWPKRSVRSVGCSHAAPTRPCTAASIAGESSAPRIPTSPGITRPFVRGSGVGASETTSNPISNTASASSSEITQGSAGLKAADRTRALNARSAMGTSAARTSASASTLSAPVTRPSSVRSARVRDAGSGARCGGVANPAARHGGRPHGTMTQPRSQRCPTLPVR
jgi:hypothetical protein